MSVESGTLGPYEILARLGSGGMGEVFLANDPKLRRRVALKFLPQDLIDDKQADERLANEASAAASLNHPRIATIYELRQEDGRCCIVMEYVEGQTLKDKIKQAALDINEAVAVAAQLAEALKAAHARSFVHCDIKSSNIMLTPEGDVNYLEEVIEATGEREASALVLRSLISDENTRLMLTLAEVIRRTQRGSETVERILELFAQARLIREIQDEEPWRYELMHEYLIDRINQITGRVMDASQRANHLLRQYLSNYSVDKRARIPASKILFIKRYSDAASGEQARELFRKSLRHGLARAGAAAALFMIATTLAAAGLSVGEE